MPRVHVDWVSMSFEMNRLINLIGYRWHPHFYEHTGIAECVRGFQNLQSNLTEAKNLQPELFGGKNLETHKNIQDSGISGFQKVKGSQEDLDAN